MAAIAARYPAAKPFAMQVKGLEMPAYHPNAAKGTALAYAVSERGACHLRGAPLGELFSGSADPLIIEGKAAALPRSPGRQSGLGQRLPLHLPCLRHVARKSCGSCSARPPASTIPTARDLERAGERISTLARLFNVREGFARAADTLPDRNLIQPMTGGPAAGHVVELDPMLDEYYRMMGWDENGVPTPQRLEELQLAVNGKQ